MILAEYTFESATINVDEAEDGFTWKADCGSCGTVADGTGNIHEVAQDHAETWTWAHLEKVHTCEVCMETKALESMKPAGWFGVDRCCAECFDPLVYLYESDDEPWALLFCEKDDELFTQHEVDYTDSWVCPKCGEYIGCAYEVEGLKERIQWDDEGQPIYDPKTHELALKPKEVGT